MVPYGPVPPILRIEKLNGESYAALHRVGVGKGSVVLRTWLPLQSGPGSALRAVFLASPRQQGCTAVPAALTAAPQK